MKTTILKPSFFEFIPEVLEEGILYISLEYEVAIHLCCCGCKEQTVTPFNKNGWNLTINTVKNEVSLTPSIGNFQFPCKSHYFITNNKVIGI